jgi:GNAT superfamily N-acetyltransferase
MAVTVRPITPDEWRVLRDVRLAALLDAPEAFYSTYEHTLTRTEEDWRAWPARARLFLAWLGGEAVGMVGVSPAAADPSTCDLVAMWVAPSVRGTGVADDLVRAAIVEAWSQGCTSLGLEVADGNVRAERLYARHGFVPTTEPTAMHSATRMRLLRTQGP